LVLRDRKLSVSFVRFSCGRFIHGTACDLCAFPFLLRGYRFHDVALWLHVPPGRTVSVARPRFFLVCNRMGACRVRELARSQLHSLSIRFARRHVHELVAGRPWAPELRNYFINVYVVLWASLTPRAMQSMCARTAGCHM
jgi:hypothetical protein